MSMVKYMLFIAVFDAFLSQIFLDVLVADFRISLSVAILPVFYYFEHKLNPMITALFIGATGLLFRGVLGTGAYASFTEATLVDFPILVFDLVYGFLLYFFFFRSEEKGIGRWFVVVLFSDFFANTVELIVRSGASAIDLFTFNTLVLAALIRTMIGLVAVMIFKYFDVIKKREADIERYRYFMQFVSDLKSEIYFMRNNMQYIEEVMRDAYKLYEISGQEGDFARLSLSIARDIHEIKKNYIQVIKGIEKTSQEGELFDKMQLTDLVSLLRESFEKTEGESGIEINYDIRDDLEIQDHYYVMSILRNLISNAIEACGPGRSIWVRHHRVEEYNEFVIEDNGQGIKDKNLPYIFDPGFSTKFDLTGEVGRGIGLTMVKTLVEDRFGGSIAVTSVHGKGTIFRIALKTSLLEG